MVYYNKLLNNQLIYLQYPLVIELSPIKDSESREFSIELQNEDYYVNKKDNY